MNQKFAIFDVDGVLADNNHRLHYITRYNKDNGAIENKPDGDWRTYLHFADGDVAGPAVPIYKAMVASKVMPIIVTARSGNDARSSVLRLLRRLGLTIPAEIHHMMIGGNAVEFKVMAIDSILSRQGAHNCVGIFEDSWQNIKAIQNAFPDVPLFRPHNLVRQVDVNTY